jgi:potassium efflux system protein
MKYLRLNLLSLLIFVILLFTTPIALGQSSNGQNLNPPDFNTTELETSRDQIDKTEGLSEEQKTQAKTYLETAATSLTAAAKSLEDRARFMTELENSPETLSELETSIENLQTEISAAPEPRNDEPMGEEALLQLEQDLIAKESELSTLRAEIEGYDTGLQNLASRQLSTPKELNEARTKLSDITTALNALGDGELDVVAEANRKALQARRYYRRAQILAFEQEIAGLSRRQEILSMRRQLADIALQKLIEDIQYLSDKTGQRRLNDASQLKVDAEELVQTYAQAHPLVKEIAEDNVRLTAEVVQLASNATQISKQTASTISQLDIVESDLRVAQDLIDTGALDRRAGATLRRLSYQLTPPALIKSDMNETQKTRIDVTQRRLIAQESLRETPLGRVNTAEYLTQARQTMADLPELTESDRAALQLLVLNRRDILQKIVSTTTSRVTDTSNLYELQNELLSETNTLQALLDKKLLWVPSVPAIDF